MASPMTVIPKKTRPRPISPRPFCLVDSRLEAKAVRKPRAIISKAYLVTLKATIWAVMVVPMLAPMMTPIDWDSDIRPAVMKPTTSTVVTDEDWITAVTKAPVTTPMKRFLVSLPRIDFMRSPATSLRALAISSIPNRKSARPPRRPIRSGKTASSSVLAPSSASWLAGAESEASAAPVRTADARAITRPPRGWP